MEFPEIEYSSDDDDNGFDDPPQQQNIRIRPHSDHLSEKLLLNSNTSNSHPNDSDISTHANENDDDRRLFGTPFCGRPKWGCIGIAYFIFLNF